jgi:hypothetical protein
MYASLAVKSTQMLLAMPVRMTRWIRRTPSSVSRVVSNGVGRVLHFRWHNADSRSISPEEWWSALGDARGAVPE